MQATLSNYRQSPRKVRLIAELIKGQTVSHANVLLDNIPKRATLQIKKLLASAVENAKQSGSVSEQDLIVSEVRVDEGRTMKRFRPVSRGRAHPIRKRTSNVLLTLARKQNQESRIRNQSKVKKNS